MRCAPLILLLLAFVCGAAAARPTHDASLPDSLPSSRHLLEMAPINCTAVRAAADTRKPFCYVPDTISPEARQFLSTAAAGLTAFSTIGFGSTPTQAAAGVAELRAFFASANANLSRAAEQRYIQSTRNDSIGGVPVMLAVPKGVREAAPADTKVLLYIHGGGYAVGSCYYQLATPAATAAAAGLTIICPEYRLAPEHPFPAGLNDVLTVYKSLINDRGYKAGNIVLLGDSAGGGMVAPVAIQLEREGVPLPAALGMFSPYSDLRSRGDTTRTLIGVDPLFAGGAGAQGFDPMDGLAGAYLGKNASLFDDPLVSPVLADFAALFPNGSLPPTLIQVGLRELLLSDSVLLYRKMRQAAPAPGHVVLSPYEGMWHVFQSFIDVPEAAAASREMADYFTRALAGYICK